MAGRAYWRVGITSALALATALVVGDRASAAPGDTYTGVTSQGEVVTVTRDLSGDPEGVIVSTTFHPGPNCDDFDHPSDITQDATGIIIPGETSFTAQTGFQRENQDTGEFQGVNIEGSFADPLVTGTITYGAGLAFEEDAQECEDTFTFTAALGGAPTPTTTPGGGDDYPPSGTATTVVSGGGGDGGGGGGGGDGGGGGGDSGTLPATGANGNDTLVIAGGALVAGVGLLAVTRLRRRPTAA